MVPAVPQLMADCMPGLWLSKKKCEDLCGKLRGTDKILSLLGPERVENSPTFSWLEKAEPRLEPRPVNLREPRVKLGQGGISRVWSPLQKPRKGRGS